MCGAVVQLLPGDERDWRWVANVAAHVESVAVSQKTHRQRVRLSVQNIETE